MRRNLALILGGLLAGCNGDAPGEWTAIVYPDASDRAHYSTTYRFQSLAMCRRAAAESIAALPEPANADYRCGHQCTPGPGAPGIPVCRAMTK